MFENIIGQDVVVAALKREIETNTLPSALFFHGPAFSGKLSTALELARVVACAKKGGWSCDCESCRLQRPLRHSDLLLLGNRAFEPDIKAAAGVLKRIDKPFARHLFVRNIRKLMLRFHPVLWEGQESRISKPAALIERIESDLELIDLEGESAGIKDLGAYCDDLVEAAIKLSETLVTDNISVQQVRNAAFWSRLSPSGRVKVVIFENADRMMDSSRSALLKILEEPPENARFILTAQRRSGVIETLRSRLRHYAFLERDATAVRSVLSRIFRDESSGFDDLREYFLDWTDVKLPKIRTYVRRFFDAILERHPLPLDLFDELGEKLFANGRKEIFPVFLEELVGEIAQLLRKTDEGDFQCTVLEVWNDLIRESDRNFRTYNLSPIGLTETLFQKMRAAMKGWEHPLAVPAETTS